LEGFGRAFSAHDAVTGAQLWKTRFSDVPAFVPISYSVNGHQYVATVEVFEVPAKAAVTAAR
jgi:hypothetical protein